MTRTITIKGVGTAKAKPDYVVLGLELESRDKEYVKAMDLAADKVEALSSALVEAGFEKESIKTTDFNVNTVYDHVKDKSGDYRRVFGGYEVKHTMNVSFDFSSEALARALSAISGCVAHPQVSVTFTIKDATAIKEELLQSATKNARRKAEILCDASGANLGDLLSIDYSWHDINFYSQTNYALEEDCMALPMMAKSIEIEPEDIHSSDTVTFVWEIK